VARTYLNECDVLEDAPSIPRSAAIEIASVAWRQHIRPDNIVSGFAEAGIFPPSRDQMQRRLDKYATGGLPAKYEVPEWAALQASVRRNILTVPLPPPPKKPRKKIRVGGQILTLALLKAIAAEKKEAATASKPRASRRNSAKKTVGEVAEAAAIELAAGGVVKLAAEAAADEEAAVEEAAGGSVALATSLACSPARFVENLQMPFLSDTAGFWL
jgi:hypothetical protein